MSLRFESRGECLVIFLEGEIDLHQVDEFRDELAEILASEPQKKVVLNCSGVSRMDSSGVGLFIFLRSRYKEKIVFRICELPERILELFRMTQLGWSLAPLAARPYIQEVFFDMDAKKADSLKALQG